MEAGSLEQTTVVMRLIAAAMEQEKDPGWTIQVQTTGIQITYTWQSLAPLLRSGVGIGDPWQPSRFYTVENLTLWTTIALAKINPLLAAMDDLIKQKTELKP